MALYTPLRRKARPSDPVSRIAVRRAAVPQVAIHRDNAAADCRSCGRKACRQDPFAAGVRGLATPFTLPTPLPVPCPLLPILRRARH